jgi:hypothetical protein
MLAVVESTVAGYEMCRAGRRLNRRSRLLPELDAQRGLSRAGLLTARLAFWHSSGPPAGGPLWLRKGSLSFEVCIKG